MSMKLKQPLYSYKYMLFENDLEKKNEWKTYEYAEHIWCDYWIFPVPVSPATDHNLHKLCHVTKASCRADDRFKLQKKKKCNPDPMY